MAKQSATAEAILAEIERIKCAAIERDGKIHDGLRSHYQLRCSLSDTNPAKSGFNDVEGFLTTGGRFLTRAEAVPVAVAAGQLQKGWLTAQRALLSSDLDWDATSPQC